MIRTVNVKEGIHLEAYSAYSSLVMGVRDLTTEALLLAPRVGSRKIWMVNSTAQGGGVAEMMPGVISMLRQLGISCDWVVTAMEDKSFFHLTKKIHNQIHGKAQDSVTFEEKMLYEKLNRQNADKLLELVNDNDIIVIHDPQPMPLAMYMKGRKKLSFIWRCHIGLDKKNEATTAAWDFLQPYSEAYDLAVFSAAEYIPTYFSGRATVIHPGIDPLNHKNRELPINKLIGILCNANVITEYHPVLTPPFTDPVKRLQPDGSFQCPLLPSEMGILFSPTLLQVSRWDRLKGFLPLMKGFEELKSNIAFYAKNDERHQRQLELAFLVLAGPDPTFIEDDPEGNEVVNELAAYYQKLPPGIQSSVAILMLPMSSRKNNELIVNALQRVSTVVVQNSIREGFGLTVTEAMYKAKPVIGTSACGIREQVRDNIDGKLINDPQDAKEIAQVISHTLKHHLERGVWEINAQKRATDNLLIFSQIQKWLRIFASIQPGQSLITKI